MILLDSDVLLIELRYTKDPRFAINRQALQRLQTDGLPSGVTAQALLETVGVLSFNTSPLQVPHLAGQIVALYKLAVLPDLQTHPDYAGCSVSELLSQMSKQMSLGDAVQALQIAHHAASANCLLTWNAKHFQGKLIIPVLTPEDWLNQLANTP